MKKILVADWLDKYGGAERVLTVLNRQYDFEKCYGKEAVEMVRRLKLSFDTDLLLNKGNVFD